MRSAVALAVVAGVIACVVVAPAGASHDTGDQFIVQLTGNGDAEIILEETYNLSVEEDREAFERLAENETARDQRRMEFGNRLQEAMRRSVNETGREMSVSDPAMNVTQVDDETGVLHIRAHWRGLAAVVTQDDTRFVVVTEPFAGGFSVNRSLIVRGPEGYTRADTSPPPGVARKNLAIWDPDKNLEGFEAAFAGPTGTATDGSAGDNGGERTARASPDATGVFLGAAALALIPAVIVALGIRRTRES